MVEVGNIVRAHATGDMGTVTEVTRDGFTVAYCSSSENCEVKYNHDEIGDKEAPGIYVRLVSRGAPQPAKEPLDATRRADNAYYNIGVLDSSLREVSWILRNLIVNAESMSPERVRTEARNGLDQIHRSYTILKPVSRNDRPGGMLSQDKLPPVN